MYLTAQLMLQPFSGTLRSHLWWLTCAQVSLCCTHSSLGTLTQSQAPGLIKPSKDKGGLQVAAWNAGRLPRIWPSWQLASLQPQG